VPSAADDLADYQCKHSSVVPVSFMDRMRSLYLCL